MVSWLHFAPSLRLASFLPEYSALNDCPLSWAPIVPPLYLAPTVLPSSFAPAVGVVHLAPLVPCYSFDGRLFGVVQLPPPVRRCSLGGDNSASSI
jgi:hypothetical protein